MTAQKHTPGPWWIAGKGTIRHGDPSSHESGWIGTTNWRNREANARLIAAAPELLTLLKNASDADSPNEDVKTDWWNARGAAIAKAEGRE